MREQSHMLHTRSSRDRQEGGVLQGWSSEWNKWRPDHKAPYIFAFLTGDSGLRVQHGSRKDKSHQIYLFSFFFLDRVTSLSDERKLCLRYMVDKNGR